MPHHGLALNRSQSTSLREYTRFGTLHSTPDWLEIHTERTNEQIMASMGAQETTGSRSGRDDIAMPDALDGVPTCTESDFPPGFDDLSVEEQEVMIQKWQAAYHDEATVCPLALTIGVEIECILLQNTDIVPIRPSSIPGVSLGSEMVHTALSRPMRIRCSECSAQHDYSLPLNSLLPDREETGMGGRYNKWSVGRDILDTNTLKKAFDVKFQSITDWHIEIRSRILSVSEVAEANTRSDCRNRPLVTYEDEVKAVYDRLHEDFQDNKDSAWRVFNNKSCGLHVHIGNGANRRLPLDTVKNVVNLHTANEKAIDNMHSSTRINGSTLITKPMTIFGGGRPDEKLLTSADVDSGSSVVDGSNSLPESASFINMAYQNRQSHDDYVQYTRKGDDCYPNRCFEADPELVIYATTVNTVAWNKITYKARHLQDLRMMHEPKAKNCAVNLTQMFCRTNEDEHPKQTIEFRQAAGTLDPVESLAWIDVLIRLVNYAHNNSTDSVVSDCEAIWKDPDHSTLDFLAMLGLGKKDRNGVTRPEAERNDPHGTFKHYRYVLGLYRHDPGAHASYADERLNAQLSLAANLNDFFSELMVANAQWTYAEKKPETVNARLHDKFMAGCYGQYQKGFLRELAYEDDWEYDNFSKDELQGRLVNGWRIGEPIRSRPLDGPEEDETESGGGGSDIGDDTEPRIARPTRGRRVIEDSDDEMDIDSI